MKKLITAASALLAVMLALPAAAQFAKPEDAIKYRKAAFTVMGAHFGRVGAMATGKAPYDAKAAAENAEIWKDAAKFKEASDKMQAEMTKLAAAAKAGNADALKTAFGPAAATCKGCHDNFRKD